ncbi:hypothetical protein ACR9H1_23230 [Kosakonia cowanii]
MTLRLSGLQNCAVIIAGWRSAYPAYKNRAVVIAGWRCAYPAYKTVPWILPGGDSLTRPTEHTSPS